MLSIHGVVSMQDNINREIPNWRHLLELSRETLLRLEIECCETIVAEG